jgi:hypothetical protein
MVRARRFPFLVAVAATLMALLVPLTPTEGTLGATTAQAAPVQYKVVLPEVSRGTGPIVPRAVSPQQASSPQATPASQFTFGVYPGGGTGETPNYVKPSDASVVRRMSELASGRKMLSHLYTAWSWHNDAWLDGEVQKSTSAGYGVVLTVKYSPPPGHEGDVAGYEAFVRAIVRRYAAKPGVVSICIGNEANNVNADPNASDGPYPAARLAVARGLVVANQELIRMGSPVELGFNFVYKNDRDDAAFVQEVARLGGDEITNAVKVVGVQVYPGIWFPGGPPYSDMTQALKSARASVDSVPAFRKAGLQVLETGAPLLDENDQASRLDALVRATLDNRAALNIVHFDWFDLWDADTSSGNQFSHYGLLRSDLSTKPAFELYKQFIAAT